MAPNPDRETGVPAQIIWSPPAMTLGIGLTVTAASSVFTQPAVEVPVTV